MKSSCLNGWHPVRRWFVQCPAPRRGQHGGRVHVEGRPTPLPVGTPSVKHFVVRVPTMDGHIVGVDWGVSQFVVPAGARLYF